MIYKMNIINPFNFEGTILGKIEFENDSVDFLDPNIVNLVDKVSTKVIFQIKFELIRL